MQCKTCTQCGVEKSIIDFHKQKAGKYGVTSICKVCTKSRHVEWYTKNREKRIQETTDYRKNNPEINKKAQKKWRLDNLHMDAAKSARRRFYKKNATPLWASGEFESFFVEEIYRLSSLRSSLLNIKFEVDHIVPLNSTIVCGLHCKDNLRIIPASCNLQKSNKYWPDMP